jgi:2-phosphosulfolactate phosphatase
MNSSHGQADFAVRFDWGLNGAAAIGPGARVAVVVDVLSFTTTLTVALDRGIAVLPYPWRDDTAAAYAEQHDATLATGRSRAVPGRGLSLSPASVRQHPAPPARIVLPSPNGSTIARHLQAAQIACVGASLRNAAAVATWLHHPGRSGQPVAFIAAGEKWPDGTLRPAAEDAWGAGAVISELALLGWRGLSPEAEFAQAAYERIRGHEDAALLRCASGQELADLGYLGDVEITAEINESPLVPLLTDEQFTAADPQPPPG